MHMNKTIVACFFAMAAIAASSPALAQASKAQMPCIHRGEIRDVRKALDNRSLFVQDNARKYYIVKFTSACHFLSQRLAVRFVTFTQTRLACLEPGDGIVLPTDFGSTPRCLIESIDYLRPERDLRIRGPRGAG
jgi:hypothetical protein